MNNQTLSLKSIVRRDSNKRHAFSKDRRLTLNCVIAEYVGNQDHEPYRKAFYAKGEPFVPDHGTHADLNALEFQG